LFSLGWGLGLALVFAKAADPKFRRGIEFTLACCGVGKKMVEHYGTGPVLHQGLIVNAVHYEAKTHRPHPDNRVAAELGGEALFVFHWLLDLAGTLPVNANHGVRLSAIQRAAEIKQTSKLPPEETAQALPKLSRLLRATPVQERAEVLEACLAFKVEGFDHLHEAIIICRQGVLNQRAAFALARFTKPGFFGPFNGSSCFSLDERLPLVAGLRQERADVPPEVAQFSAAVADVFAGVLERDKRVIASLSEATA
ncbi:MAG TPA: hypothetical protein PLP17_06190, partial [Oligoflexia bacterium]|nr:hypothetical protein [Oligoflexia bacterium]